jgi:hypothetical protein
MAMGRLFTPLARARRLMVIISNVLLLERGGVVAAADGRETQEHVWKDVVKKRDKVKSGILEGWL